MGIALDNYVNYLVDTYCSGIFITNDMVKKVEQLRAACQEEFKNDAEERRKQSEEFRKQVAIYRGAMQDYRKSLREQKATHRPCGKMSGGGVYVLYNGDNVVYIGRATKFSRRVRVSIRERKKFTPVTHFGLIHASITDTNVLEPLLIGEYHPICNKQFNDGGEFTKVAASGIDLSKLDRWEV